MGFEPDELGDVVLLREAGDEFLLVLEDAFGEVGGYADVEDAGFAGHEVDVVGAFHWADCDIGTRSIGRMNRDKDEERFLSSQADHFTGVKWKEKTSACSVRNDGGGGVADGVKGARREEEASGLVRSK